MMDSATIMHIGDARLKDEEMEMGPNGKGVRRHTVSIYPGSPCKISQCI